ncbi:hypothetical protein ONE63_008088 [Megalurothrips usitatus]|uniref:Ionotropic glutamate receptor C-terminal domain-containing protein n=1 Tax=Megalurothrips usitatus TaxID=439358 RepID=A0AAV7XT21_9NEOP|nr:hypothetical protein ONE63_008088 [Megalurothrips usitatus]
MRYLLETFVSKPYPEVCRRKPAPAVAVPQLEWNAGHLAEQPGAPGASPQDPRPLFRALRHLDMLGCTLQVGVSVENPFARSHKRKGLGGVAGLALNEWAAYGNFTMQAFTSPTRQANLHYEWAVPAGLVHKAGLTNLFNELEADVWLCVLAALLLMAAALRVTGGCAAAVSIRAAPAGSIACLLAVLASAMLGVPASSRWRRTLGSPVRVVFVSWILFVLVLTVAYQSMLLSRLTTSVQDHNIHSLAELAELDLPVCMSPSVLHYVKMMADSEAEDASLAAVLQRAKVTTADVFGVAFEALAVGRNMSALWPHEATMYALQRLEHRYHEGKTVDYKMHSFGRVLDLPMSFLLFDKGSPLKEQADHVLGRLGEAGIMTHWLSVDTDVKRWHALRGRLPDHVVLSVAHVKPVFCLYVLGHAIALTAFVAEFWTTRAMHRLVSPPSAKRPAETVVAMSLKSGVVVAALGDVMVVGSSTEVVNQMGKIVGLSAVRKRLASSGNLDVTSK